MVSKLNIFIFNHSDEKTSNKLEEIIDLIKKAKKDISKKNNNNIDIPEFIFGDEMDDEYFLLLFKKLILDIISQKPENIGKIRTFFYKAKFDNLYTIFNNDFILSKIKKDAIINILIDKGLNDNQPDINLSRSIELIKGICDEEFSIQNINLEFKEVNLKNNNKFQLNKDALKQFLNSEAIISAVEETLKHFEDIKINNPGKSVLKDKVVNFIENTKFYSIKLSDNIYAFTIYNGNIFINKNIIDIANDNNNKQQLSALAIILVSIIHEFMHYLVRILSDDPKSKNYFLKTKKRIKKTENIKISESGIFLEDLLIGNYKGFFSIDAEFLLDINNYNDSFKIFSNKFYDNNTKYHSKADEETFLKRGFLFDDRDDSFLKRGCCLKGFMRGYEI